jgi:hypothetical protein
MKSSEVFDRNFMPDSGWHPCRRKIPARATKVDFPFCVIDADGHCTHFDCGYLVVDDSGYPVGMTVEEYDAIYGAS